MKSIVSQVSDNKSFNDFSDIQFQPNHATAAKLITAKMTRSAIHTEPVTVGSNALVNVM